MKLIQSFFLPQKYQIALPREVPCFEHLKIVCKQCHYLQRKKQIVVSWDQKCKQMEMQNLTSSKECPRPVKLFLCYKMYGNQKNSAATPRSTSLNQMSSVFSFTVYGCQSWKITTIISGMLLVFQNRCLWRILNIFWPNTISKVELHRKTSTSPIMTEIKRRIWTWIGHIIRKPSDAIPKIALSWTPSASRRRQGKPKETWRRSFEREMKEYEMTWSKVEHLARNKGG